MENVGALTFRGLDTVLGSLTEIGYNAEWQDIRASDMGAPHKRERIWVVAYSHQDSESNVTVNAQKISRRMGLYMADTASGRRQWERGDKWESKTQADVMADTRCKLREQGNSTGMETGQGIRTHGELYNQSGGAGHGRNYWSVEPALGELVDGLPDGLGRFEGRLTNKPYKRVDQLKGLGNAIVPQIAELLFRQIKVNL